MTCRFRNHQRFDESATCIAIQLNSALPISDCRVEPAECIDCLAETIPPDSPNQTVRAVAVRLLDEHGFTVRADFVREMPRRDTDNQTRDVTPPRSNIGTLLTQIFVRELGSGGPCAGCANMAFRLDMMTVAEVQENRAVLVSEIAERARTAAPTWWQRLAVAIDQTINLGETERRIGVYLDEACYPPEK